MAIATHLEILSMDLGELYDVGFLPQALMGIRHAPKLREVHMRGAEHHWGPMFCSLSYLTQVTRDICSLSICMWLSGGVQGDARSTLSLPDMAKIAC